MDIQWLLREIEVKKWEISELDLERHDLSTDGYLEALDWVGELIQREPPGLTPEQIVVQQRILGGCQNGACEDE